MGRAEETMGLKRTPKWTEVNALHNFIEGSFVQGVLAILFDGKAHGFRVRLDGYRIGHALH
jgi:hypothetical protein